MKKLASESTISGITVLFVPVLVIALVLNKPIFVVLIIAGWLFSIVLLILIRWLSGAR